MVHPRDIAAFDPVAELELKQEGFVRDMTISQLDAGELMNVNVRNVPRISQSFDIPVVEANKALVSPLSDILGTASRIAWDAEISWHLGVSTRAVSAELAARDIAKEVDGWLRARLIEAGILPRAG